MHVEPDRGVKLYRHHSEGFWGQSVSECALALTLCALRRIPQQREYRVGPIMKGGCK